MSPGENVKINIELRKWNSLDYDKNNDRKRNEQNTIESSMNEYMIE